MNPEGNMGLFENKYQRMFENIQDVYYEVDLEGRIVEVSPSVEARFGWDRADWLGHPLTEFLDDGKRWEHLLELLDKQDKVIDYESFFRRRDGTITCCSVNARTIATQGPPGRLIIGLIRDITERKRMEDALRESEERYQKLSITDGLTGLYNLRHFYDQLTREISRSARYGYPLCLLVFDIDDFKAFNDTYGHKEGDTVLVCLAEVTGRCIRSTDTACRYGGEEFAVILPHTNLENGMIIAERIRTGFSMHVFSVGDARESKTVSIGVALYQQGEDMNLFIQRTDKIMYAAKRQGKNRVLSSE